MNKLKLISLVGITSIALAQVVWAGHAGGIGVGGGGGFGGGGGHFGGGGHVGGFGGAPHFGGGFGGFHAPSPAFSSPRVGVGTRGGGVGFGMGRYSPYQSAPSSSVRSVAARSANSPARVNSPSRVVSRNRTENTSTPAKTALNRPNNRGVSPNGRQGQTARSTTPRPSNEATLSSQHHIFARETGAQHRDWDRRHAHFSNGHWYCWDGAYWIGLDDGYYPWDFYPYYGYDYYPYDYYTDVEPADQGYTAQQADPNVTAVQTDLAQLGYYNGTIDGLFGADTRSALARYQIDRHLQVTGSLTNETLQSLGLPALASN